MRSKYRLPRDLPAAACGRCLWWKQIDADGWGQCLVQDEKTWYKCMVCSEYEMDNEINYAQ